MQGGDVGFERFKFLKDVEGPPIDDFPFDGQPDAVAGPLEDADSKAILHGLDGFAHRGLYRVHSLGGTGKASLPGHFHQYLQRADIQHLFFPCIVLMSVFSFHRKNLLA